MHRKLSSSNFLFFTRDPNSTDTISAFDEAVKWAMEGKFSDEDITEAKLSVFASVSDVCAELGYDNLPENIL